VDLLRPAGGGTLPRSAGGGRRGVVTGGRGRAVASRRSRGAGPRWRPPRTLHDGFERVRDR
jgi:hypothetical protein